MRLVLAASIALLAGPALAQSPDAPAVSPPTASAPGQPPAEHAAHSDAAKPTVQGAGEIKAVDAKDGEVTLHHDPIASLGWPAMTMTFKAAPETLKGVKPGQAVTFTLAPQDNLITAIQPK